MQLRRIEIRDFRKLGHAVIDDIGDGLSIVVGDNEAGKSTVLAALRAVLFERHRVSGKVAEAMLPYGQNVRPEVSIDFDLKGARWRLRKAFNQRQETELVGPDGRITGDAVEDRLAELFAFTPPGRGESKREEHQGLYGLLWVEQGRSHHSLGVGGGKDVLASAIESEVGQVIGGERGRALLAAAAERNEVFWGKNDKPRGEYQSLLKALDTLKARRAELQESLRQHDGKVEALIARDKALARHAREDRLAKTAAALKLGQQAVARAASFERARDEAVRRRESCAKDRTIAQERRQRRADLIGKVEAAQALLVRAALEAQEARRLIGRRQGGAELDEKRLAEARAARIRAEQHLRLLEQALEWQRRSDGLKVLEDQLARAEAHAAQRREILASVAGTTLRPKDIEELDGLQRALDKAGSELRAASVEIGFEPEADQAVTLDGAPLAAGIPLHLSRDASLRLEGFGRLTIRPGGGVEALARAHEAASRGFDDRLRSLAVTSVAEARSRLVHKGNAEAEAAGLAKALAGLAPKGIDALRESLESERAALSRAPGAGLLADEAALEEARRALEAAASAEAQAEAQATGSRATRDQDARDLAVLDDRAMRAQTEHESRIAELGSVRSLENDEMLRERLAASEQAWAVAEAEVAKATADLMSVDPETARLDLERAEQAERSIGADINRLKQERRDLEIELGAMGRSGLGEELSHVEGEIERLEREKVAKDREAAASRLLLKTLSEAQRESKDRWLGPIRERVKPYLRFLQPESDIVLNEQTLEIEGIVRNGVKEPFQSLSMGAREQMAVITRLALADILRDSGQPSALILDDALVNSDPGRLQRMHRVLQTAAKSLQVLVLTCRENDFVGLGDIRRL